FKSKRNDDGVRGLTKVKRFGDIITTTTAAQGDNGMATSAADAPRGDSGDDDNADITFVVPGQLQEIQAAAGTRAAGAPGTVKASVRVGALRGGGGGGAGAAGDTVRVTA